MNMCSYVKGCVNSLLSESEIKLSLILFSVVSLTAITLMVSNINPLGVELLFCSETIFALVNTECQSHEGELRITHFLGEAFIELSS